MNIIATRPPERQTQWHPHLPTWLGLLALLALSPAGALGATYEGIDCPEADSTDAHAINDRGDIVGSCADANGDHGYLLRHGEFTMINYPGGVNTAAFGVNNRGDVVGRYGVDGVPHGFLLRNGRFTTINVPGSEWTVARGIDD
ncbi:MAG: hypothetical protein ACREVZ_12735, partial [Burkholderiales bacterium]